MSLEYIKENLILYQPVSNVAKDVHSVLSTYVYLEPQPDSEGILSGAKEDLLPSAFYNAYLLQGATVLFRLLKNHLVLNSAKYTSNARIRPIRSIPPDILYSTEQTQKYFKASFDAMFHGRD